MAEETNSEVGPGPDRVGTGGRRRRVVAVPAVVLVAVDAEDDLEAEVLGVELLRAHAGSGESLALGVGEVLVPRVLAGEG